MKLITSVLIGFYALVGWWFVGWGEGGIQLVGWRLSALVVLASSVLLVGRVVIPDSFLKSGFTRWNKKYLLPALTVLTLTLFVTENILPVSLTGGLGLNYLVLVNALFVSFVHFTLGHSKPELKQKWPVLLFVGFLLITYFLSINHGHIFIRLSRNASLLEDDNFMEWLQVGLLLLGSVFAFVTAISKRSRLMLALCYVVASLMFLVLVGEEISWGERIFDFEYELNTGAYQYQKEFNLHNQEGFNQIAAWLYYLVFIYAVVSWWLYKKRLEKGNMSSERRDWWNLMAFRKDEVLYFLPTFLVNPYISLSLFGGYIPSMIDIYNNAGLIGDFNYVLSLVALWRETFEVLFYTGLVIHFFRLLPEKYLPDFA